MDAAEPFNAPVNPEALGIPVSVLCEMLLESTLLFLLLRGFSCLDKCPES